MDFLKKFTEATKLDDTKETPTPTTTATIAAAGDNPPSQTELFASAQVVAEAAKAAISRDPANVDNYKLAGATADILDAAEHYGKLDSTTGIGGYLEKAEGYLKKYESSNSPPPPKSPEETAEPKSTTRSPPEASPPPPAEEVTEKKEEVIEETTAPPPAPAVETATPPPPAAETATPPPPPAAETATPEPAAETEKSEGGIGDYVKKAEGLLEKKEGGDSGSGFGGALKAAGDFWKKN